MKSLGERRRQQHSRADGQHNHGHYRKPWPHDGEPDHRAGGERGDRTARVGVVERHERQGEGDQRQRPDRHREGTAQRDRSRERDINREIAGELVRVAERALDAPHGLTVHEDFDGAVVPAELLEDPLAPGQGEAEYGPHGHRRERPPGATEHERRQHQPDGGSEPAKLGQRQVGIQRLQVGGGHHREEHKRRDPYRRQYRSPQPAEQDSVGNERRHHGEQHVRERVVAADVDIGEGSHRHRERHPVLRFADDDRRQGGRDEGSGQDER